MADLFFQNELNKINALIPKLERFSDLKLADIPEIYRKEIASINVIPQFTSGGIESMVSVLNTLYFAKYMVENEIKPVTQSVPEKIKPLEKSIDIVKTQNAAFKKPVVSAEIVQNIPIATPQSSQSTPKPSYPSPTKVEEKYKKENPLDFGPYSK